jgi:integrase
MRPLCAERHEERWRPHLAKPLGNILVRELTRAHLAAALEKMSRKGSREGTRKTLTTLNLMLDYGLTRHVVDQNFARVLKPKDFAATAVRSRDRALSLIELRQLWRALDYAMTARAQIAKTALLTPMTAIAIKLLILTGARRSEVAGMSWAELDLSVGTWLLPWNRTKNGRPHIIYLSDLSIALLKELHALTGQSFFVFDTGRASGIGHINSDSLNHALARLKKRESGNLALSSIEPFTIHDLRRSAAIGWGEHLKILPHIIEHMLNHQPANKLMATYQRAVYAEEQKATWLAWGAMIEHQVAKDSDNVIPFNTNKH